ncbi:MAG TPA: hypothetical protein VGQ41_06770 [Pyrinomonadaceae bacterium]|jgi:hypothetical protein|nr:hypothetical protein [Pyrinomonadaceae bacterium]
MFESDEQKKRAELIVTLLAKLYVVLELSGDSCPVCHKSQTHDSECPITLAWSLLTEEEQREARTTIRTLALTIGTEESHADELVH